MHSKRRIKRDKKNCVQPEAYGRTVKVRWGYLMLLGILFSLEVAAFSANAQELQPERMQAIKKADNQASVNWKLVSQEINEKNEYVYDGDKTDVNAANLAGWWHVKNGWVDWSDGILETADGWHSM